MHEEQTGFLDIARRVRDGEGDVSAKSFRYQFLAEPIDVIAGNLLDAASRVFEFDKAVLFLIEGDVLFMHSLIGDLPVRGVEFLESYRTWISNRDNLLMYFLDNNSSPQVVDLEQAKGWFTETEAKHFDFRRLAMIPIHRFDEPVGILIIVLDRPEEPGLAQRLERLHALADLVADNLFFSLRMQSRRNEEQWRGFLDAVVGGLEAESGRGRLMPFVLDKLMELDKIKACAFFTRRGRDIAVSHHRGFPDRFEAEFRCRVGEGFLGEVFDRAGYRYRGGAHKGIFMPDDNWFPRHSSFIHQPIVIGGAVHSALTIISGGKILLTRMEILILKSLANHLTMAFKAASSAGPDDARAEAETLDVVSDLVRGRYGDLPAPAIEALEALRRKLEELRG